MLIRPKLCAPHNMLGNHSGATGWQKDTAVCDHILTFAQIEYLMNDVNLNVADVMRSSYQSLSFTLRFMSS